MARDDRRVGLVPLVKPAVDPRGVILRKYWVRFDNASKFLRVDKDSTSKVYTNVKNYNAIEDALNNRNITGLRNYFGNNSLVWDNVLSRSKNIDSIKQVNPEEFNIKSANQLLTAYTLTTEKVYLDHSVNNLKSAINNKVSISTESSSNGGEESITESTIKSTLVDNTQNISYNLSKFLNFMYMNKGKLSKLLHRLVFSKDIFNKLLLVRQLYDKSDANLINLMINDLMYKDIDDGWLSYRYMLLYALDKNVFNSTLKSYPYKPIDDILSGNYNNLTDNDKKVFIYFHNKKVVRKYLNNIDDYLYYSIRKDVDYNEVSNILQDYFKMNIGSLLSIKFNKFDLISLIYMSYTSLIGKYVYIPYDSIYHLDDKYLLTVHSITKYIKNLKSFMKNQLNLLNDNKISDNNIECYLNVFNDYDSPDGQYFIKIKPIMVFTLEPESDKYVKVVLNNKGNIFKYDNNLIVLDARKSLFKRSENSHR